MSYSVAPAPGPKPRPGVVATASVMLYVSAVLLLVAAGVSFVPLGRMQSIITEQYADQPESVQQGAKIGAVVGPIVVGVVYVLIAIGLVVLGVLIGKGKQPARVITWVLAGISVLCFTCGLAGSALSSSLTGLGGAQDQELLDALATATPGWVTATSLVAQIVLLLLLVTVIILLALPAASDFFRKEQQVWVPPTAPWPADPRNFPPPPPPGATL